MQVLLYRWNAEINNNNSKLWYFKGLVSFYKLSSSVPMLSFCFHNFSGHSIISAPQI